MEEKNQWFELKPVANSSSENYFISAEVYVHLWWERWMKGDESGGRRSVYVHMSECACIFIYTFQNVHKLIDPVKQSCTLYE